MSRNRTKAITIALVLVLTIAATFLTCLPSVNAADVDTYAFLTVTPSPVGVGQTVIVNMWLNLVPPQAVMLTGEYFWPGYTVTITKPDTTTQTMGPYDSDPVGAKYISYVPATTGTYYFQFSFPGFASAFDGNYYKPSISPKVSLTVQQAPVEQWPPAELPTDYWQRPIEKQNREWSTIAGNWLGVPVTMSVYGTDYGGINGYNATGAFNPYTRAPNSAHIVWTKPITFGGLVGGESDVGYYTGLSYEPKFTPPIVMQGILYYNTPDPPRYGFTAVDLRTGETLWWRNTTRSAASINPGFPTHGWVALTWGQIYDYESPNQHGSFPYLWGTNTAADGSITYSMYDAITGNWILDLANAALGNVVMSPAGDVLVYILDGVNNRLSMWNSSRVSGMLGATSGTGVWTWRPPTGATLDWRTGVQWNVSVPDVPGVQSIERVSRDIIVASSYIATTRPYTEVQIGYSAKTGQQLWTQSRTTLQQDAVTMALYGHIMDGVFTYFKKETMQWYGFDVYTGAQLWGPTDPYENGWGMYSQSYLGGGVPNPGVAYGKLYSTGYDGRLHCYNLKTGDLLWTFYTGSSGFETPYGQWPLYGSPAIADGKIYALAGEHSPSEPMWRGGKMYCLDSNTGKNIWNISGWMLAPTIADGYLVTLNNYDGQVYCFGKGKTATTVSVGPKTIANGSSTTIEGTVLDMSPGAEGTPAISDKDMSAWMEYLYMQKPCPTTATGVPVLLQAMRSDGTVTDIATVTSDVMGHFEYLWTPPAKDTYKILATFLGSESYWMSSAQTALGVTAAPPAAEPVEIPAYPDYTLTIIGTGLVIIVAIAVAILILRKRP